MGHAAANLAAQLWLPMEMAALVIGAGLLNFREGR